MFDPKVQDAIKQFSAEMAEKHPEIGDILHKVQTGELGEAEATGLLMNLVVKKGLSKEVESMAEAAFAPTREGDLVPVDGPAPPAVMQGKTGLPRMNPLLEGAIKERLQYDGDVPEARKGPLPEGATPAVPVDTDVRNPVALGVMLEEASFDVQKEIDQKGTLALQEAEDQRALAVISGDLVERPTGCRGYEAGMPPSLRKVKEPTGSALAAMTPEERKQSAWKALSTTQGRRSALKAVEEIIRVGLESEGFPMGTRGPKRVGEVPVHALWTMDLSGPNSTQSNFSFIDTAARALLIQLVRGLRETPVPDPVLEVTPVNMVDVRKVGWAARVVPR